MTNPVMPVPSYTPPPPRDSERLAGRSALREVTPMAANAFHRPIRVLVTRPREEADSLAAALAARSVEAVVEPLLEICYRVGAVVDLDGVQAVLCTSGNGPQKTAAWTLGDPHIVRLAISAKEGSTIRLVSGKGEVSYAKVDTGNLALELTQLPQYVSMDGVIKDTK